MKWNSPVMASSVLPEGLEKTINKLVELRRQREKRDHFAYSQTLLDVAKTLEARFGVWVASELKDLLAQADLLLPVSDGQAKDRLLSLRSELLEIKSRKLPDANKELKSFLRKMKKKELSKTSEVIHSLVDEVSPSVSIIVRLNKMRGDIDSLADMTLSIGGSVEEITPEEKKDLEQSQDDITKGDFKKSSKPEEIIDFLKSE
jgi:hypothetical protein